VLACGRSSLLGGAVRYIFVLFYFLLVVGFPVLKDPFGLNSALFLQVKILTPPFIGNSLRKGFAAAKHCDKDQPGPCDETHDSSPPSQRGQSFKYTCGV
jgi:hypothetical protein